jgi:hypothetical protein
MFRTQESTKRVSVETIRILSPLLFDTTMKSHYYGNARPALRHNTLLYCTVCSQINIITRPIFMALQFVYFDFPRSRSRIPMNPSQRGFKDSAAFEERIPRVGWGFTVFTTNYPESQTSQQSIIPQLGSRIWTDKRNCFTASTSSVLASLEITEKINFKKSEETIYARLYQRLSVAMFSYKVSSCHVK